MLILQSSLVYLDYLLFFHAYCSFLFFFFFQAEDGIRDADVTGVQTCALPISPAAPSATRGRTKGCARATRSPGATSIIELSSRRRSASPPDTWRFAVPTSTT